MATRSLESRWRQGATRLGLDYDHYRYFVENGWRWCSSHHRFEPVDWFGPHRRYGDGLNTRCRESNREIARKGMARLRAERRTPGRQSERVADHLERQRFADLVLLAEMQHPHDATWCRIRGECLLHAELVASAARIAEDGRRVMSGARRGQ